MPFRFKYWKRLCFCFKYGLKIILVDDHVVVRNALKQLIQKLGPFIVSKELDDGQALVDELPELKDHHIILLDISMPVLDGMETLLRLKQLDNKIPVLILTDNDDDAQAIKVFRLGARGYLRKNCTAKDLKEAINSILNTGYYHNEYFKSSIEDENTKEVKGKITAKDRILADLSQREKLFLKLVCHEDEFMYTEIAEKMNISIRAVDKCREDLFAKCNVKSKTGLVLYVFRFDLYKHL
jgi:two-component system, NarL family, invasion response regulator UvrY